MPFSLENSKFEFWTWAAQNQISKRQHYWRPTSRVKCPPDHNTPAILLLSFFSWKMNFDFKFLRSSRYNWGTSETLKIQGGGGKVVMWWAWFVPLLWDRFNHGPLLLDRLVCKRGSLCGLDSLVKWYLY